jgi:hypothetical protein
VNSIPVKKIPARVILEPIPGIVTSLQIATKLYKPHGEVLKRLRIIFPRKEEHTYVDSRHQVRPIIHLTKEEFQEYISNSTIVGRNSGFLRNKTSLLALLKEYTLKQSPLIDEV